MFFIWLLLCIWILICSNDLVIGLFLKRLLFSQNILISCQTFGLESTWQMSSDANVQRPSSIEDPKASSFRKLLHFIPTSKRKYKFFIFLDKNSDIFGLFLLWYEQLLCLMMFFIIMNNSMFKRTIDWIDICRYVGVEINNFILC